MVITIVIGKTQIQNFLFIFDRQENKSSFCGGRTTCVISTWKTFPTQKRSSGHTPQELRKSQLRQWYSSSSSKLPIALRWICHACLFNGKWNRGIKPSFQPLFHQWLGQQHLQRFVWSRPTLWPGSSVDSSETVSVDTGSEMKDGCLQGRQSPNYKRLRCSSSTETNATVSTGTVV